MSSKSAKEGPAPAGSSDRLALWDRVKTPEPQYTKKFERGTFRGTAINATYLAQLATREFGPCGIGWGTEIVAERYVEGHMLGDGRTRCQVHVLQVKLWYVLPGTTERASVEQFGQTTFVGQSGRDIYTDEEAPKKSYTDGLSKCLSLLGFAADIYLGHFDDNKHVAQVEASRSADDADSESIPDDERKLLEDKVAKLGDVKDTATLDLCDLKAHTVFVHPAALRSFREAVAVRRQQLAPSDVVS